MGGMRKPKAMPTYISNVFIFIFIWLILFFHIWFQCQQMLYLYLATEDADGACR